MDTSIVISAVIGLVVISLVISAVIQQKEQIAAAKKQKAAQYIYRSKNAQELLEKIRGLNINSEIIRFVLNQITNNLKTAASIWPKLANIKNEINRAQLYENGFKTSVQKTNKAPVDETELRVNLAKMNRLIKYLKTLHSSTVLNKQQFESWVPPLIATKYQYEVDGLLKFAIRAVDSAMPGTARNHIENIENKLRSNKFDEAYKNQRLSDLNNLKLQLKEQKSDDSIADNNHDNGESALVKKPKPLDEKTKW